MDADFALYIVAGLGLLGGVGLGVKAVVERKMLKAKAANDDASAAAIVTAAARELIDPLRKELAAERAENAAEIARERSKVRQLSDELEAAISTSRDLRIELNAVRRELDHAWVRLEACRRRVNQLEAQAGDKP